MASKTTERWPSRACSTLFSLSSGTKDVVVDVDDDGVVSLNFECCDLTPDSKFMWSKNYEDITDSSRLVVETKGNK